MSQRRTTSIHVLSRMAKLYLISMWVLLLMTACTIRSGEEIVLLQPASNQISAIAVRFVGSEGVMSRTIPGLVPDAPYVVSVQAQLQSGAMQLTFRDVTGDSEPFIVVPGRVAVAKYTVTSSADGEISIEEMTYQSRGGEYQLRFEPLIQPNTP